MPMQDGTGPLGRGPGTGRGNGLCGFGLGWRGGSDTRRGLCRYYGVYNRPQTDDEQRQSLAEYRKALEEELEDVKQEEQKLK